MSREYNAWHGVSLLLLIHQGERSLEIGSEDPCTEYYCLLLFAGDTAVKHMPP